MERPLREDIRNIGIISHIDAGKTTVSERILYYTGETHKMGEVHDGETVMDWMPQEQERGITITATSTTCRWGRYWINLIDTPGHIDFTIEVERSMRVLDGAVAILSAVEGVQPQTESVWRQADRYRVPRVCFINKMDRVGADYRAVLAGMEARLKVRPVLLQLPMGSEAEFDGVIDLLCGEWLTFSAADQGRTVERRPVPAEYQEEVQHAFKIMRFMVERGAKPILSEIKDIPVDFGSPVEVFEFALEHETKVTENIDKLVDLIREENDKATEYALQWFVTEQIEEESTLVGIIEKLKRIGDGAGLYLLDKELAARQ